MKRTLEQLTERTVEVRIHIPWSLRRRIKNHLARMEEERERSLSTDEAVIDLLEKGLE